MSENKLYPMRLCSLEDKYVWGKEIFKVADLGYRDSLISDGWLSSNTLSEVMDTYMDRVVGDNVFKAYGRQFPIQVKIIECATKMPLRVHPDDTTASERYDALGREKLWYILKASPQARLVLGFEHDSDASKMLEGIKDGSIEKNLLYVNPHAGESFRIKPGLIHGAIGEIEILEISQSSALDFCVYPWGQALATDEFDSALTIIDALDFIEYKAQKPEILTTRKRNNDIYELLNIDQFVVNKIELHEAIRISSESVDTFAVYIGLYGKASIKTTIDGLGEVTYSLEKGNALLVPAEVNEITIEPLEQTTSLLEAMGQYNLKKDDNEQQGE